MVGVGTLRVEGLVGPHDRYQVLRVGEVGYGMGAPGDHLHHAHVGAIDDVLVHRVGVAFGVEADPAQLDAGGTGHHQEPLPLRHMPVVALGDARLGHVDGHLASVGRAQELREASALVDVGFQAVGEMPRLVVREERRVELLREAALGEVRHPEGLPRVAEALEQFDYLAERRPLRAGGVAVAARLVGHAPRPLVAAAVHLADHGVEHGRHQVVYVEELQLHGRVVDGEAPPVGDGIAERGHGRVVVGSAPLAVEVREAVHQGLGARALGVIEKELLAGQLALAVGAPRITAAEGRLHGARQHHRAFVSVALQHAQQHLAEAAVALHELGGVLGAVDAGEVEYEVGVRAVGVQLLGRALPVVLVDRQGKQALVLLSPVLAVGNVVERLAEVSAHEPLGAGDQHLHATAPPRARGPRGPAARTRRS